MRELSGGGFRQGTGEPIENAAATAPARAQKRGAGLDRSAFVALIQNAALLLALVFVYDLLTRFLRRQTLVVKLVTGLLLGVIAVAVMLAAFRLSSGVIFDTRSVVLSMGTLFYGTVPGAIAGAIAAVYRASQGGPGAVMGVSVCVMSVVVGAAWRRWRHVARRDPGVLELYLFGLTVHALMLALTVTLPWSIAQDTLADISVPVIVIYPLASVLLGLLMIDQRRRRRSEEALRESEERFVAFAGRVPGRLWIRDRDLRYLYVNPQLATDLGRSEADLIGRTPEELWEPDVAASGRALCERALRGEVVDVAECWPDEDGRHYRSLVFAVRGEGDTALLGGLMFDVTEQHEAQQELERHTDRLRLTVEGAVLAMGNIVERRDPYTAGHERRVAELAVAIATRMGMSGGDLNGLRLAALIHDVGKISVPAEILSKPGRISQNEFELIKVHAQAGHDVLQTIAFEQPVARMVLQHHERLDGSGYPDGLRGDDILPQARVMAVADVYEAMTSHRPYRPGLPREAALAELREGAGVRYDAAAVEACLQTLDGGFTFASG
jgi:PAS domain S-box-containing protein/putative nucleotidyltransferase with HDIG domain